VTRTSALVALVALVGACTKDYKVRVEFSAAVVDRRLATGKSDSIDGIIKSADGNGITLLVDGELETVPRADIARVDQKLAKRDVTYGTIFAIGGGVLTLGGALVFECGQNEFPLFCSLSSERNLGAAIAFIGGIALASAGLRALVTGKTAQSRVDDMLRGNVRVGWDVAPTMIGDAPGLGAVGRF
jgi:hypothetical protein